MWGFNSFFFWNAIIFISKAFSCRAFNPKILERSSLCDYDSNDFIVQDESFEEPSSIHPYVNIWNGFSWILCSNPHFHPPQSPSPTNESNSSILFSKSKSQSKDSSHAFEHSQVEEFPTLPAPSHEGKKNSKHQYRNGFYSRKSKPKPKLRSFKIEIRIERFIVKLDDLRYLDSKNEKESLKDPSVLGKIIVSPQEIMNSITPMALLNLAWITLRTLRQVPHEWAQWLTVKNLRSIPLLSSQIHQSFPFEDEKNLKILSSFDESYPIPQKHLLGSNAWKVSPILWEIFTLKVFIRTMNIGVKYQILNIIGFTKIDFHPEDKSLELIIFIRKLIRLREIENYLHLQYKLAKNGNREITPIKSSDCKNLIKRIGRASKKIYEIIREYEKRNKMEIFKGNEFESSLPLEFVYNHLKKYHDYNGFKSKFHPFSSFILYLDQDLYEKILLPSHLLVCFREFLSGRAREITDFNDIYTLLEQVIIKGSHQMIEHVFELTDEHEIIKIISNAIEEFFPSSSLISSIFSSLYMRINPTIFAKIEEITTKRYQNIKERRKFELEGTLENMRSSLKLAETENELESILKSLERLKIKEKEKEKEKEKNKPKKIVQNKKKVEKRKIKKRETKQNGK